MATRGTKKELICKTALKILETHPDGLRYSELIKKIHKKRPDLVLNTIHGSVWNLHKRFPEQVYKPAKGIFRLTKFKEIEGEAEASEEAEIKSKVSHKEEEFYKPFADWLVNEMEECTRAIPVGSKIFKDKWGTPDVIGIRESRKLDLIQAPTEVVSAEIKIDTQGIITAFGQSCSYKLFSHKCYIVIPKGASQEDISKIDSLCMILGLGLVLFDSNNPDEPQFEIRVRPRKHEPDMFYVNKYMRILYEDKNCRKLFGA